MSCMQCFLGRSGLACHSNRLCVRVWVWVRVRVWVRVWVRVRVWGLGLG